MTSMIAEPDVARIVRIRAQHTSLVGELVIPPAARSLIILVQGDGSSRRNPCSRRAVADLQNDGFATLLLDLFTPEEQLLDATTERRQHDSDLVGIRLALATDWLRTYADTGAFRFGFFADDSAATAALIAAARRPRGIGAIVIRRGSPEPSRGYLGEPVPPTLVIVAGDGGVVAANRAALSIITSAEKELVVVPRTTAEFSEPGAAEQVAQHALRWFESHLTTGSADRFPEPASELC